MGCRRFFALSQMHGSLFEEESVAREEAFIFPDQYFSRFDEVTHLSLSTRWNNIADFLIVLCRFPAPRGK